MLYDDYIFIKCNITKNKKTLLFLLCFIYLPLQRIIKPLLMFQKGTSGPQERGSQRNQEGRQTLPVYSV